METLKDKTQISYDHLSRYANFPYYYHTMDNKFVYGLTHQLDDTTSYVVVDVDQNTTLDLLAAKYYGRPDYFWVIADFNRIQDPFSKLCDKFKTIKIPSLSNIEYQEG